MTTLDDVLTAEVQMFKPKAKRWYSIRITGGACKTWVCTLCRDYIITVPMRVYENSRISEALSAHAQGHADEALKKS